MWEPSTLSPRGPVYLAIADALSQDVRSGRLRAGDRLPTHRDLARQLGVNVVTVTRAYAEAARRGLVEGEVGRGTFVSSVEPRGAAHLPLMPEQGDVVDFHFNLPVAGEELVDLKALYTILAKEKVDPLAANYLPGGSTAHREAGAKWIGACGLEADPDRTFVTSGGQHAMSVAFATLLDPGDTVLTEELTYPGMKALASLLHVRALPVAMDDKGILPDAFEAACRKGNPKALYCMPTIQNPTGIVWPEERRREVAEIARRYGVVLVEDDTTGFLVEEAPLPFARIAPDITLFLTTTSKSLGPGLRIGYVLLPEPSLPTLRTLRALTERFLANLAAITWMAPPLMSEITTRLIHSGRAQRIVEMKRKEVAVRRELFDRLLGGLDSSSHSASSFVWLSLPEPWRCGDFIAEARQSGVAVSPAETFVVGRAHAPHAVRVCIGTPAERGQVQRGLDVLGGMLSRSPAVCRSLV